MTEAAANRSGPPAMRPPRVPLPALALGLALAYLPSWIGPVSSALGWGVAPASPADTIWWNWLAVGLLALHVGCVERLGPRSLRLVRPSERDLDWAGYLAGAMLLWHWLVSLVAPPSEGAEQLIGAGPVVALALVLTVSLTEEILWRGYVVERLGAWIGLRAAATLGLAVFVVPHVIFFGWWWLASALPGSVLLYVLLVWRRNLWSCMVAHFVLNVPVVIVALLR